MILSYYDTLYRKQGRKLTFEDTYSDGFQEWRSNVEKAELVILGKLGFCTLVDPPHKLVIAFIMWLDKGRALLPPKLFQAAWDLANLCTYTPVCLKFKSDVVACGVLYLAARQSEVPLVEDPPWWDLLKVKRRHMLEVAADLLKWQKKDLASFDYVSPQRWLGKNAKKEAQDDPPPPKIPPPIPTHPPIPPPHLTSKLDSKDLDTFTKVRPPKPAKPQSPPRHSKSEANMLETKHDQRGSRSPGQRHAKEGVGGGASGHWSRDREVDERGWKRKWGRESNDGREGRDSKKVRREEGKRKDKSKKKERRYRDEGEYGRKQRD